MSTIAELAVNIVADTSKFTKAVGKARKETKDFGSDAGWLKGKLGGLQSSLAGVAAGFGTALVGKFSYEALRRAGDEIDRMAKSVDTLGISTERFDGLNRSANLAGATSQDLTKAMSFMERAISNGSDAFKSLGMDVNELRQLRPELQLLEIADAMKEIGDNGKRLQLTKDIFGKGGESLVPMMLQGSKEIRKEMAMLTSFSREEARAVEEANDAETRLYQSWERLKRAGAIAGAGPLKGIMDAANRLLGGTEPEAVSKRIDQLDKLTDTEFADFRRRFGENSYRGMYRYFGRDAAHEFTGKNSWGLHTSQSNWAAAMARTDMEAAIRERELRMEDELAKRHVRPNTGMAGLPLGDGTLGALAMGGMNFAMHADRKAAQDARDMANSAIMQSMLMMPWMAMGQDPTKNVFNMQQQLRDKIGALGKDAMGIAAPGAFGQEAGTAEAFRQERRSAEYSRQMDDNRKQIDLAQAQLKQLEKIAGKNDMKLEVISIN